VKKIIPLMVGDKWCLSLMEAMHLDTFLMFLIQPNLKSKTLLKFQSK